MPSSFAVDDKNTGIFRINLHVCRMFGEDHRLDLFELSVDNGNCGCIGSLQQISQVKVHGRFSVILVLTWICENS